VICLALSSPDGDALLETPSTAVAAWLERTLRAVPPGSEHEQLSMDDGLSALLAPAAGDEAWLHDPFSGPAARDDTPDAGA
jgi:hypothetical protein